MWENFFFLVIFDTCDVSYNLSISLFWVLPSIVHDNLFAIYDKNSQIKHQSCLHYRDLKTEEKGNLINWI